MLKKSVFVTILIFFFVGVSAQNRIDTLAIKKELEIIFDRDQKTRTGRDSSRFVAYIDSCNLVQVEKLISKYGWLGKSFVGVKGNQTTFLVIQHSDLAIQLKYFPLFQKSVEEGESKPSDLALMQDRILMSQGKKQLYGSQIFFDKTGTQEFYQIDDEKNVNARRAKVGLEPIEEYAKRFGIEYKPPQ